MTMKLMHMIMLSCLKATELIEKKLDHKLNLFQNVLLHMHKSMCKACSAYEKQSHMLDKILKYPMKDEIATTDIQKLKSQILEKLQS